MAPQERLIVLEYSSLTFFVRGGDKLLGLMLLIVPPRLLQTIAVVSSFLSARLGSLRVFANCDTARTQAHTWQTKHGANGLKNSRKNSTTGCLNVWGS
ncbi:Hypothetical protein NTJ_00670 [Nesidiocoris tenuis]|uniref:Uncharacterized protein n=1 Tax=Nesidiocoris tenuis TaxID=355587 RepID=A0ABN7A6P1_9HEMI|nr:Hypothetical protein NTJ_00670 [Nesidiocoris tenuis]